jgi:hypothetical protein
MSAIKQESAAWIDYDEGEAPWTEDEQFELERKECKERCAQWGKSDCPRPDHTCSECQYDAQEILQAKYRPRQR